MVDNNNHSDVGLIVERMAFLEQRRREDEVELKALTIELAEALNVNFQTDRAEVVYNS